MTGGRGLDEADGVLAETGGEFFAAVVGQGSHFDEGFTDAKAGASGKIFGGDVHVDDKVVARDGE